MSHAERIARQEAKGAKNVNVVFGKQELGLLDWVRELAELEFRTMSGQIKHILAKARADRPLRG